MLKWIALAFLSATLALNAQPSISTIAVGNTPDALAFDGANVWVGNEGSNTVTKLRIADGTILGTFTVAHPSGATFDGANVWLTNGGGLSNPGPNTVTKLRATDGTILGTFAVGTLPVAATFDGANVWVANYSSNNVTELRAIDGAILGTIPVGMSPSGLAFDGANIWVTNTLSNNVTEIRAVDATVVGTFPVGNGPYGIVFDGSSVWAANGGDNTVTKLNASNGAITGVFAVGANPGGIAFDGTNVWVANFNGNSVTKLRAADGAILGTFAVGVNPWAVVSDGANIWVTNGGSGTVSKIPITSVLNAPAITVRSGNGTVGGTDASIHFLLGPATGDFGHVFTASDFSAAQTGPAAFIVSPNPLWIPSLTPDPSAKWIGTNADAGCCNGNTALYAVSFTVPAAFGSATLALNYAADDGIGETAGGGTNINTGVYLNGVAICGSSFFVGFSQGHVVTCGDVTSSLIVGTNWLYIEDGNAEGPAGLLFSATFTTTASVTTNPQPVIASLSPTSAAVGSLSVTLAINGTGFVSMSSVTFNGIAHTANFVNGSQLTIMLTASDLTTLGTFAVVVTNPTPGGGASNSVNFTVRAAQNPSPTITSLSPASVQAGSNPLALTVNGTGFTSTSVATFNGSIRTVTYQSSSQLTVELTAPDVSVPGSFLVVVTNPPSGGSSPPATFGVIANGNLPSINAGGVVNSTDFMVPVSPGSIASVFGTFPVSSASSAVSTPWPTTWSGLSMQFSGIPIPLQYASPGQVNVQIPWELNGQTQALATATFNNQTSLPQTVQIAAFAPGIFVMNAQGQGAITDPTYRLVDSANPAVPGTTYIEIYCTGLGPVTNQPASGAAAPTNPLSMTPTTPSLTIGGVSATVLFSGLSPTAVGLYQVNAQVPAGVQPGNAVPVVLKIGGATSNTVTIAVQGSLSPNPTPTITSLSPSSVAAGSSSVTLTINGTGLVATSSVTFNGISHTATVVNGGQITITLTASDLSESGTFPVIVTNPAPGGGLSNSVNFTVTVATNPEPTITGLSPSSAPAGSNALTLTINGSGFLSNSTVTYDGVAHAVLTQSASQLTITLAASDLLVFGSYPVIVTNPSPGGGVSPAATFTLTVPTTVNLTGNFTGAWGSIPSGAFGTLSAMLTEDSSAPYTFIDGVPAFTLTGTITLNSSLCFSVGVVSGLVAGNVFAAIATFGGQTVVDLDGYSNVTGTAIPQGAYAVKSGLCAGDFGIFDATKN